MESAFVTSPLASTQLRGLSDPRSTCRRRRYTFPCMAAARKSDSAESAESSWSFTPDGLRDWREMRARLIAAEQAGKLSTRGRRSPMPHAREWDEIAAPAIWAHRLSRVEEGCCLLASRSYHWPHSTEYLAHAVVLITDVHAESGIQGLILNRPTGSVVAASPGVLGRAGHEFRGNPVHLGGDCCMGHLEVLHGYREVAGAKEIVPGLYRGGLNGCRAMVAGGEAGAGSFRFLISYTRWTWVQFAEELELGAWEVAAVSPELMMESALRPQAKVPQAVWADIYKEVEKNSG